MEKLELGKGFLYIHDLNNDYIGILLETPGLENYISGILLNEENKDLIKKLDKFLVGISLEEGFGFFENKKENYTRGLKTLDEKCKKYSELGFRMGSWKTMFKIDNELPSEKTIDKNINDILKFVKICENNGMIPLVDINVLRGGDFTMTKYSIETKKILSKLFHLNLQCIIKINLIVPSSDSKENSNSMKIATYTYQTIKDIIPESSFVILSQNGQSDIQYQEVLSKLNDRYNLPWNIMFNINIFNENCLKNLNNEVLLQTSLIYEVETLYQSLKKVEIAYL